MAGEIEGGLGKNIQGKGGSEFVYNKMGDANFFVKRNNQSGGARDPR